MRFDIPTLKHRDFSTARGEMRLTDSIAGLLGGQYPALRLPAQRGTRPERPPVRGEDIPAICGALRNLGHVASYGYVQLQSAPPSNHFEEIEKDTGWHVDSRGHKKRQYYPYLPVMSLRRHTAASKPAHVQTRLTRFDERAATGFRRDNSADVYEAIQEPGDIIYFISLGGIVELEPIRQTEHSFKTIERQTRQIHLAEFEFRPKKQ